MNYVIIGNSWDASRANPTSKHQIAFALGKMGHRVLWIDGAGMRRPNLVSGGDRGKIAAKLSRVIRPAAEVTENIWRLAPLIIPLPKSGLVRRVNTAIYSAAINRGIRKARMSDAVLISFLPTIPQLLQRWRGKTLYYCVDRWDQFAEYDSKLMEELDAQCCRNADIVIASAQDLYERCARHNKNTRLIEHGVDHAHFATALGEQTVDQGGQGETPPADRRRIGFFGLISEWVDQELLMALSRIDNCEVILAGKADVDTSRLEAAESIRMIGPVPYEELPKLVGTFDVGIIPFKVNELTRAVNPIKLREMLAAGCPVVSSDLPEVRKLGTAAPEGVVVAATRDEFVAKVEESLERRMSSASRREISDIVRDQDWSAKVEWLVSLMSGRD